jgi:DNA-damage-inducible protein J
MAGKSAFIRARTEPGLKERAESILRQLGLSPSAAINMFYRQIVIRRSLPFDVALPNPTTVKAMREARDGRDLIEAEDVDELIEQLDDEGDR